MITECLEAHKIKSRRCIYDPMVTLLMWIGQLISSHRSCTGALSRLYAYIGQMAIVPDSPDTGAYCKARKRLCSEVLNTLYQDVATNLEDRALLSSPFEKRRVLLVDGTSVSAPDTPGNQAVYPQHANQAEGCGFPMIKLTALFSLSTGAVHSAASGDLQTSEIALFRDQVHHIKPKDLIVADRHYGSYADLYIVRAIGAYALCRLHQARQFY